MFGGSQNYGLTAGDPAEARPAKRPRNLSGPADHHHPSSSSPYRAERPPAGEGASGGDMPPPGSTGITSTANATPSGEAHASLRPAQGSKGRTDDKNNRKLSCKECRRLKLKCDRVFPCQSCVKRGCGSLCPEGALTSGRGSRFILANTGQLHEKIAQLSDRVRQLEDGLQSLHSQTGSNQTHPLLTPELLKIKTSQELYGGPQQTVQSLGPSAASASQDASVSRDERLRESVGSLSIDNAAGRAGEASNSSNKMDVDKPDASTALQVPPDILQLSATFPFPWCLDLEIRRRIREALPPRKEALLICEEARKNALWQYNLDSSETFIPNLLHYCYTTPIEKLSPRRLALLLMVLSIGSLVDLNRPLGSVHGEAYHHLARAAVCEIPLMEEPDFDVLHALFLMLWYHLIFSDNNKAIGYAWNLMGFVAKLAQGSLSLGRPPSICLAHVDVKPPTYVGPGIYTPQDEIRYHEWKTDFFTKCLSPVLEAMVATEPPAYTRTLELDKLLRDYPVPPLLDEKVPGSSSRSLVMQRALVSMGREIAMLQLHRKSFTCAMSSNAKTFDLHHRFAPSVVATYLATSSLIATVERLFDQEQQLSARFLHFWFNSFSAAVTLSLLISRAPATPLARHALQSLERARHLFVRSAKVLPFCAKALPVVQKLADKSQKALTTTTSSSSSSRSSAASASSLQNGKSPEKGIVGPAYSNERGSAAAPPAAPHAAHVPAPFERAHGALVQWVEAASKGHGALSISTSTSSTEPWPHHRGGASSSNGPSSDSMQTTPSATASTTPTTTVSSQGGNGDPWIPDIYRFASVGMGLEDRYLDPIPQPVTASVEQLSTSAGNGSSPFVPSLPRVAETKDFNFEHGDLTVGLVEETSWMAWF